MKSKEKRSPAFQISGVGMYVYWCFINKQMRRSPSDNYMMHVHVQKGTAGHCQAICVWRPRASIVGFSIEVIILSFPCLDDVVIKLFSRTIPAL